MANIANRLTGMSGVFIHEEHTLSGASEFLSVSREREVPFLVSTNSSIFIRRDLSVWLAPSGLDIPEENTQTPATTTVTSLITQPNSRRAHMVGGAGLTIVLYKHGLVVTNDNPDFVVLGETRTYSTEALTQAIRLIGKGARFVAINPDVTGSSADGSIPATSAVATMTTAAADKTLYYVGKPNPAMLRTGLSRIDVHSEQTVLVGDRMDIDILAGMGAGLQTHLVLTGSTTRENVPEFVFRPQFIHMSIVDIVECVEKSAPVQRG